MDAGALAVGTFCFGWLCGSLSRHNGLRASRQRTLYPNTVVQPTRAYDPSSIVIVRGPAPYDWQKEQQWPSK